MDKRVQPVVEILMNEYSKNVKGSVERIEKYLRENIKESSYYKNGRSIYEKITCIIDEPEKYVTTSKSITVAIRDINLSLTPFYESIKPEIKRVSCTKHSFAVKLDEPIAVERKLYTSSVGDIIIDENCEFFDALKDDILNIKKNKDTILSAIHKIEIFAHSKEEVKKYLEMFNIDKSIVFDEKGKYRIA